MMENENRKTLHLAQLKPDQLNPGNRRLHLGKLQNIWWCPMVFQDQLDLATSFRHQTIRSKHDLLKSHYLYWNLIRPKIDMQWLHRKLHRLIPEQYRRLV